jgi:RHS repeat-associated protein
LYCACNFYELFSSYSKGRLTTVTDTSGTTKFYYDKLGRITQTVKTVDGVSYTTSSSYDAMGRPTGITYPDPGQETVTYQYDTGGNLDNVVGYARYSSYNALGQAGLLTYANGDNTVYLFDPYTKRPFSITTNSQAQGGLQNLTYAYDNVGNIRTITDLMNATSTQNFQYDELNRIRQAQSTAYSILSYSFDAIGNMTYNSQVGSYSYPPPGYARPHAVTQAGANSYSYDGNGNMTGRNGATLTYDYDNRLSGLVNGGTTTTFVYDSAGGRVKKTSSSITTLYIGNLYECTSGVCTKHIFAGGSRIVSKKPTATYYYHTDHLGSSSVVTDASGYNVEEIYYYPFGQTRVDSGSVNLHNKYTGQEQDGETGLYYYNARYYDPAIGRFISADTIVPDPFNPQAFNRYSYVLNNPLSYTDPTGHSNEVTVTCDTSAGCPVSGGPGDSTTRDKNGSSAEIEWGPIRDNIGDGLKSFGDAVGEGGDQVSEVVSKAKSQIGSFFRGLFGGHKGSGGSPRPVYISVGGSGAGYVEGPSAGAVGGNITGVTTQGSAGNDPVNTIDPSGRHYEDLNVVIPLSRVLKNQ